MVQNNSIKEVIFNSRRVNYFTHLECLRSFSKNVAKSYFWFLQKLCHCMKRRLEDRPWSRKLRASFISK